MSVVLTPPLNAPANPAANAVAGGNLVVGRTYYFKICARTHNSYTMNAFYRRCSPPSVEVNATTDISNKTITVSWDAVTDANAYYVYVRWDAGNWKCINTLNPTTTGITYDFTTESSASANAADLFAYTGDTPLNISKDTGVGIAVISGAETLDNIYDMIVANYPNYAEKAVGYYVFRFHIQSSGTGSLTIPYGTIICPLQCTIDNPSADFTWTWQYGSKLYINAWSWRGLENDYNMNFQEKVFLVGALAMGLGAKAVLFGGDNYVSFNLSRTNPENAVIDHLTTGINGTGKVENVEVIGGYLRLENNDNYAENCKALRINHHHNGVVGSNYFRDCEATETSGFNMHIYYGLNLGADLPFYDCIFNSVSDSNPNKPLISYYNTAGAKDFHAGIFRSVKLKVIKANGDAIVGASVKMWDKDDNLVLDTTTDQNGEITKTDIKIIRTSWQSGSVVSSMSSYEEYGPFTLKIYKNGYYLYKSNFDLTQKIDCTIALPPAETEAPATPTGLAVDTPPGRPSGLGIEDPDPAPARPSGLIIEEV